MHSTCSSFLDSGIYFIYMQYFKCIYLIQCLPLYYKLLLLVMNSNAHFLFCFEISSYPCLSFLSGFDILESFPQAAISVDKRVWNSIHKHTAYLWVRELVLYFTVYQNKHGNTASNRTEFTQQGRHTVDFTSGTDLQHWGGYFISGDKVLYVQLTATHHLQSQKHMMMAWTLVVLLLLFPCFPPPSCIF